MSNLDIAARRSFYAGPFTLAIHDEIAGKGRERSLGTRAGFCARRARTQLIAVLIPTPKSLAA
jgi:hypothetical protein